MRLVDADTYGWYTGDHDTDESIVNQAVDKATKLLEERLGRGLSYGTYTERLPVYTVAGTFTVFPSVTPLAAVLTNGTGRGDQIADVDLDADNGQGFGVWNPASGENRYATVTYLAGFTPDSLPESIIRDICACALRDLQDAAPSVIPVGASSVRVGEVALSFGANGAPASAAGGFEWSSDTLRWRKRKAL
jgi:hypothetical protein